VGVTTQNSAVFPRPPSMLGVRVPVSPCCSPPLSLQDARRSIATSSAAVYARTTAAGSGSGAHTPRTTAEEEERVVFLERDGAAAYATLPLLGRAGFNVMCVGQLKNAIALFLRIKEPLESIALHAEADGRPLVLNRDHSIETALRDVKWQPRLRSLRRRLLVRWEVRCSGQRPAGGSSRSVALCVHSRHRSRESLRASRP